MFVTTEEFVGSDAAADELKAMRSNKELHFRNICVRVRDGAHAAGRPIQTAIKQRHSHKPSQATSLTVSLIGPFVLIQADAEVEQHSIPQADLGPVHLEFELNHLCDLPLPAECQNLPQICCWV